MATHVWATGLAAATAANAATRNVVFIALDYAIEGTGVGGRERVRVQESDVYETSSGREQRVEGEDKERKE